MSLKTPKSAEWRFLRGIVVRPRRCQDPHPRRRGSDAHPTDSAPARGDHYHYVFDASRTRSAAFPVAPDGTLGVTFTTPANGLPGTSVDLVVR